MLLSLSQTLPAWVAPSSPSPTPGPHQGFASSATVALVFFVLGVLVRFFLKRAWLPKKNEQTMVEETLPLFRLSSSSAPSLPFIPVHALAALVSALSRGEAKRSETQSEGGRSEPYPISLFSFFAPLFISLALSLSPSLSPILPLPSTHPQIPRPKWLSASSSTRAMTLFTLASSPAGLVFRVSSVFSFLVLSEERKEAEAPISATLARSRSICSSRFLLFAPARIARSLSRSARHRLSTPPREREDTEKRGYGQRTRAGEKSKKRIKTKNDFPSPSRAPAPAARLSDSRLASSRPSWNLRRGKRETIFLLFERAARARVVASVARCGGPRRLFHLLLLIITFS